LPPSSIDDSLLTAADRASSSGLQPPDIILEKLDNDQLDAQLLN